MRRALGSLIAILFLWESPATCQTDVSTIRGSVHDGSGASIPEARVVVTDQLTNFSRELNSDGNGEYEIASLRRGTYRVTVSKPGFKTFVASNVILESRQIRRIDATLELGEVATEVRVSANAAVIETESAKIQSGFSNVRYDNFPSVSNFFDPNTMLATLPLVQSPMGGYGVRFAGQQPSQIQEGMDGVTNDGIVNQINNLEDAAELQAVMVNSPAEYSRVGNFNLTTKSGTNQYHGRVYYFQENSALNARDFYEDQKTKTLIHTFGGQVGGRIVRDKTFFFGSYNAMRLPSKSFFLRSVPTERFRNGDFGQLPAGRVVRDPLGDTPFPSNTIPSARFSPVAVKTQEAFIPRPNAGGPDQLTNNFFFRFIYPQDLYRAEYITGRVDHNFSSSHSLSGRYATNWFFYVLPGSYPGLEWTRLRHNHHIAVTDTYVFSPRLVNTFKFGLYNEKYDDGETVDGFTPKRGDDVVKQIGLQGVNPRGLSAQGFPRMNITGYSGLFVRPGGPGLNEKTWNFADNLTWNIGRHVVKLGGELRTFSNFNGAIPEGTYGVFGFDGSVTGHAYGDFLLGIPRTSQRLDPLVDRTLQSYEFGLFIQDTFKVNSRLSLDYGLRWDYFGAPTYEDGLMFNWDPRSGNTIVPQSALNRVSPLYPKTITVATGQAAWNPERTNFAPRLGAAYRLTNQTVLRGGYGIYTETIGRYARVQGGGPFQLTETFVNEIRNNQPQFTFPNPYPAGSGNVPSQSVSGFPLDTKNGMIHQFNATVEQQWKDIGFRLSYVGSRSRGLNYNIQINKPQPSLTPFTTARRPYPQFVSASLARNNGRSTYNALAFEAQRKFGRGLTFQGHWTWSSNLHDWLNLENPYAPLFWNRDNFIARHRVSLNAVYELPFGQGRSYFGSAPGFVNAIVGGWTFYYLSYFQTGSFFSPSYSGADPSNTNSFGGIPDRIANGNLPPGQRTIDRWFDTRAFTTPQPGRFGNSGLNVLEGPGLHVHHLSISKMFRVSERFQLQYMLGISNVFNHPNFHFPDSNVSVPGAGVIGATYGGGDTFNLEKAANRRMDMKLRLQF